MYQVILSLLVDSKNGFYILLIVGAYNIVHHFTRYSHINRLGVNRLDLNIAFPFA
jgi:hypothetical protein